jgi:hypothetical protein
MRQAMMKLTAIRVWRTAVFALAFTLSGIPAAFASSPSADRVVNAWRRIESVSPRMYAKSWVPATAAASSTRRRAAAPPAPSACSPAVIAQIVEVGDFALDDHFIYFIDGEDQIARVVKTGGTPALLGEVPGSLLVSMTTDDTRIYFATWDDDSFTGSIYSIAKDGGPIKALVRGLNTPFALAVDGQFIYWVAVGTPSGEDFLGDRSDAPQRAMDRVWSSWPRTFRCRCRSQSTPQTPISANPAAASATPAPACAACRWREAQ